MQKKKQSPDNKCNRWSPIHELVPDPPLRHGHAISIDMAYSATLSNLRGLLSTADHMRILNLFSRAGLSMDHSAFDGPLLKKATSAILRTRNGKLRAAVPVSPMGECVFLNDVSHEEMCTALKVHKDLMTHFSRLGAGIDAYVDASDTGYTLDGEHVETGIPRTLPSSELIKDRGALRNSQEKILAQAEGLSAQA